jgi:hypothetical protein
MRVGVMGINVGGSGKDAVIATTIGAAGSIMLSFERILVTSIVGLGCPLIPELVGIRRRL